LANRFRRQVTVPPRRASELLFEQNRDLLEPFMEVLTRLGRVPGPEELPQTGEIVARLGSLKRAFGIIQRVTDAPPWLAIANRRREDLLVYLALARFHRRPSLSKQSLSLQRDVKAHFGSYERACQDADALLFRAGDTAAIDDACQRASVGRLVENALLVRRDALGELEPLLRIYEGCARALLGEVEEANVVKLHRFSGKVSYLAYRDFDHEDNPPLILRIKVGLRTLDIDYFDYSSWPEPPRLDERDGLRPRAGADGV
jgi:DNA phosphorothioation-associated putative methyltransferase